MSKPNIINFCSTTRDIHLDPFLNFTHPHTSQMLFSLTLTRGVGDARAARDLSRRVDNFGRRRMPGIICPSRELLSDYNPSVRQLATLPILGASRSTGVQRCCSCRRRCLGSWLLPSHFDLAGLFVRGFPRLTSIDMEAGPKTVWVVWHSHRNHLPMWIANWREAAWSTA